MQSDDLAAYFAEKGINQVVPPLGRTLNNYYKLHAQNLPIPGDEGSSHVNQDPLKGCRIVIGVFAFTSILSFVMFTIAVHRHQKVIMDRAVASSAIVSSLFPSQVRDQIYNANDAEQGGFEAAAKQSNERNAGHGFTRPIAELYEHTTILFADIAGFTSWSSKREPVAVFELLETRLLMPLLCVAKFSKWRRLAIATLR